LADLQPRRRPVDAGVEGPGVRRRSQHRWELEHDSRQQPFQSDRVGYTYEKNGFTAKEVQDGIPMTELPPTLSRPICRSPTAFGRPWTRRSTRTSSCSTFSIPRTSRIRPRING